MGWFNIVIGVFLVMSAILLHLMFRGMRRRGVMDVGIGPVDRFNSSRFSEVPLYLLAAIGVGFIVYQLFIALLS